ncbi:MAG: hypothetical protein JSR26_07075 [Proteobacteria bacterium]|nr:hypothetical protein [Pseudomonadota bacterium]
MSIRCPTVTRPIRGDASPRGDSVWYRQGIVWLGIGVFAASIAGCIWLIVVARHFDDPALPHHGTRVLDMPLAHPAQPASPAPSTPRPPAPASP